MSKWNLSELFSHLDMTKQHMPKLRKTVRLSRKTVRSSVMEQLDMESESETAAQRCWRFGRVPAIFTAAALLLSGTAITAAAATGGFRELFQIAFGKDAEYPETLEELYAVPEAEITDTCDAIDCKVAGVFGDNRSVTVVLEFTGENGFTLPEKFTSTGGWGTLDYDSAASLGGFSWSGTSSWNYDPSDNGHLYCIQRMDFSCDVQQGFRFHYDSGMFLKARDPDKNGNASYFDYGYGCPDRIYDIRDIRNWLGFSGADMNQRRPFTAEEEQRIWENFICIREGIDYNGEEDPEFQQFVLKDDVLTEGSITVDFALEYPKTEPFTDSFVYTDPETGEETPMEMTLNPWCAAFTWNVSDPLPSFVDVYVGSNAESAALSARGHVQLTNGTITNPLEFGEYERVGGSVDYPSDDSQVDSAESSRKCTLIVTFSQPVDPEQVQEVYCLKDTVLWTKN